MLEKRREEKKCCRGKASSSFLSRTILPLLISNEALSIDQHLARLCCRFSLALSLFKEYLGESREDLRLSKNRPMMTMQISIADRAYSPTEIEFFFFRYRCRTDPAIQLSFRWTLFSAPRRVLSSLLFARCWPNRFVVTNVMRRMNVERFGTMHR